MSNIKQLFFEHIAQTSESSLGLQIEKALGVKLFDKDGKDFIDLISGVSVSSLGHNNPSIVNAVIDQAKKYMHLMVYGEFIEEPQVKLAYELSNLLPENLSKTYFLNSGSEAIETALKISKRFTGRSEIVSFKNAYHGSTIGALSLMHDSYFKNSFTPFIPGHKHLSYNNFEDLLKINEKTAAVVIEPVQAEAGIILPVHGFLQAVKDRCQETGSLLVYDEIQTAFGRTGKMFGFQKTGVIPDIIVLAKALGGGMPLGAVVGSNKIMSCLTTNPSLGHITTFGGHPVSCAAGLASLKYLMNNILLIDQCEQKEALFIENLKNNLLVKEVRSAGLLMSIDFKSTDLLKKSIPLFIKNGILTDWFLFNDTSFRISPPLTITMDEINDASARINKTLEQLK